MKTRQTLVAAAALALMSTGASALDWTGYVRVGPGQKQNSGDTRKCFDGRANDNGAGAPGHGGIGRLGNECATYGEFALSQTADMGGVNYKALLMTNFYTDGGSNPDSSQATLTHVNQIYVEGKGYDIAPEQTFWIGKRFYHRADVHWDDSFYVAMTGTGAGVDGINPGFGSISAAVFRTGDDTNVGDVFSGTRFNLDWEKMPVNPDGQLRVTLDLTKFKGDDGLGNSGKSGWGLGLQHVQANLLGATNTAWLQLARGSASLDMNFGGPTEDSGVKRWRIADSLLWLKGPVTAQTLIHYGQADIQGAKTKVLSLGGRVAYAFTNNFKLQGELGFATNKYDSGDKANVTKFTIAPTLTVGPNYYDRPELRFYLSHFNYNDTYRLIYGQSKSSKTAAGFQAEIWF
jgi:maltoporin